MLYELLYGLYDLWSPFNVFRYITFRSIAAAVTAFLIVIIFGNWFIGTMKRMQIGQVVRDDGPETHIYKQGVPTMGGLLILAGVGAVGGAVGGLVYPRFNAFRTPHKILAIALVFVLLAIAVVFAPTYRVIL